MQRSNIDERFHDYVQAFEAWLNQPQVKSIVFVENSGYDLTPFKKMAEKASSKTVEFLSFDGQDFDRKLGKGYGEMLALRRVLEESKILSRVNRFVKINGRYFVPDIDKVVGVMDSRPDVMCDLARNLTWADSRVFGGSKSFLSDYLCPELMKVNDTEGYYFEHALAAAAHRSIADRYVWVLAPPVKIVGISGTDNSVHGQLTLKLKLRYMLYKLKKKLLARKL